MYSSNRPVAHLGNSAKENCAEYLITNECNGRIKDSKNNTVEISE